jgi:hypothetical protein
LSSYRLIDRRPYRRSRNSALPKSQVIFYIPSGRSVPYRFERDLPLRARLVGTEKTTGFPVGTEIEILQAEIGDIGDVLVGFISWRGRGDLLQEIELID